MSKLALLPLAFLLLLVVSPARADDPPAIDSVHEDAAVADAPPAPDAVAPAATDGAPPTDAEPPTPDAPATDAPPSACGDDEACARDLALAARLLDVDEAALIPGDDGRRALVAALFALAKLDDPRAISVLLAHSRAPHPLVRRGALAALAPFSSDPRVRARLEEALAPGAPSGELVLALPLLAEGTAKDGSPAACPREGACVDDAILVRHLVDVVDDRGRIAPQAVRDLADLDDPRTIPVFLRIVETKNTGVRRAALSGLADFAPESPVARDRLIAVLDGEEAADAVFIVPLVVKNPDPTVGEALVRARARAVDPDLRAALDQALTTRDPEALQAIRLEEERRARERAAAPTTLDLFGRSAIAVATAGAGGCGGAAASAFAADLVLPGSGFCFGLWGCCVGAGSGAALGWFVLGREGLSLGDVGLTLSLGAMGLGAGALIPWMIGGAATNDFRHTLYASAGGALTGLALGTTAALFVDPNGSDLVELWTSVVLANLLGFGAVAGIGPFTNLPADDRVIPATLFASTLVGIAGGGAATPFVDLSLTDGAALAMTGVVGAALGGQLALGLTSLEDTDKGSVMLGVTAAGAGLGLLTGLTLSPLGLSPSWGGSLHALWATTAYSAFGIGAGVLGASFLEGRVTRAAEGTVPWMTGALMGFGGALSTSFFPNGIDQDLGDLTLQPVLTGFSLYHVAALALALSLSDVALPMDYTTAAAFMAPSVTSLALAYTAPFVDVSVGDAFVITASMAWGGAVSAMALASTSSRITGGLPAWAWIAGSALAVDGALLAGIGLDVLDEMLTLDRLGWRYTYVSAVTAASMLVFALPGSLVAVAAQESGLFYVSDAFLLSTAFGLALGLATMPFIDFTIVPEEIWILDAHIELSAEEGGVQVLPTVVPIVPTNGTGAPGMSFGLTGTF